jgi:hypothetical protein
MGKAPENRVLPNVITVWPMSLNAKKIVYCESAMRRSPFQRCTAIFIVWKCSSEIARASWRFSLAAGFRASHLPDPSSAWELPGRDAEIGDYSSDLHGTFYRVLTIVRKEYKARKK